MLPKAARDIPKSSEIVDTPVHRVRHTASSERESMR
jgi:hypothetical protein